MWERKEIAIHSAVFEYEISFAAAAGVDQASK
jgi:hypothetical protein